VSTNPEPKYRLVTRADFDGLVCAALLRELDLIDDILFVHPKDVADQRVEITDRDITTNLPYDQRCYLCFDHHASEAIKYAGQIPDNLVLDPDADSAARVAYRYYGGRERFPSISTQMMTAVDKADAARFTKEEVLNPTGWVLLNFIMDPRTGLGRFENFRISNFELMEELIDYCREHPVDEILGLPDVRERVDFYFQNTKLAVEQIRRCSTEHDDLVVVDLRDENVIYPCNRFMVYALHPTCTCSIYVIWGRGGLNTVYAIGHSILNPASPVHVGELCLRYGGGGHRGAGTVQVPHADAESMLEVLIRELTLTDVPPNSGIDDDCLAAESILEDVMAETGMGLLPSKQDIREIHERLDRIERLIAELSPAATAH
jgi:nanoRNase/pAp phosphatase (c-di-AMP/oligoRNAs hydrolase)